MRGVASFQKGGGGGGAEDDRGLKTEAAIDWILSMPKGPDVPQITNYSVADGQ